jgi:LmbE family N-acetylglucosaminyl deacetylase
VSAETSDDESNESRDPEPAQAFLAALSDPQRPSISARTAVVVAHPDDESIGCGAQLPRFSDVGIVLVTDGAPPNGVDARRLGFAGPAEYAQARRGELEAAMALVGLAPDRLMSLGWPDQEASANITAIARELARILADTDVVLTHAFEGGHPDHDSTALAVHAARALLGRDSDGPAIIEMPLYRTGPDGMAAQSFAPIEGGSECVIELDWEQQRLKQAMYAAHGSQHDVLLLFGVDTERFRVAPSYDFSQPPNGGLVYYDGQPWSMTSERWHRLAADALAELGLGPVL